MSYCPHRQQLSHFTPQDILVRNSCHVCRQSGPNLWVCVSRGCHLFTGCGEAVADHSTDHYRQNPDHRLTLNSSTFRIWCYECQKEVIVDDDVDNIEDNIIKSNDMIAATADSVNDITTDLHNGMINGPMISGDITNESTILSNEVYVADITDEDTTDDEEPLMDSQTRPRGLTGLQNLGNSCYMNAALQSLSNCPQLSRYMLDCHLNVRKPGIAKSYSCLMKEIWDNRKASYVVPTGISHGIKSMFPLFRGYTQQDAQEFLRCFLDQLHEELKDQHFSDAECVAHGYKFCNYSPTNNNNNTAIDVSNNDNNNECSDSESNSDADYETCDSGLSSEKSTFGGDCDCETTDHRDDDNNMLDQQHSCDHQLDETNTIIVDEVDNDVDVQSGGSSSLTSAMMSGGSSSMSFHISVGNQTDSQTNQSVCDKKIKHINKYHSIISDIFDGRILSSVQCLKCDNISTTRETFQDLSLPIPSREQIIMIRQQQQQHNQFNNINQTLNASNISLLDLTKDNVSGIYSWIWDWFDWFVGWILGPTVTLQDCLSAFFSADELRGDNMYSCEKCNKLRNGVKYSKVLELPEILSIHLKRFRHELMYSSKISTHVTFPLDGLDLSSYMACDNNSPTTYDLVAVICHLGTAASGHYTAYALNQHNQVWYEFDDQYVTSVEPQQVANCDAYVLFYRKSSDEMNKRRMRALELMRLSRNEPSPQQFYVSKQWVNRFNTFSNPGPITNCDFLCQHNSVDPRKAAIVHDLCTIFSASVWEYFVMTFGGGPVCTQLNVCPICLRDQQKPTQKRVKYKSFSNESL
ncbi:ubiquitin carboxyl-terminal hydrolase 33-like [Oppia nitens]|uniref:ubiquitin carboxyl-terminal hydrolase 33-like n=1 Tax=Oppia nitens TaxID=1686743 RepID=UPI0023DB8966|nr:ubiquitin carboxyl-terminal hydrolase 33-like [Oppia nitens]